MRLKNYLDIKGFVLCVMKYENFLVRLNYEK